MGVIDRFKRWWNAEDYAPAILPVSVAASEAPPPPPPLPPQFQQELAVIRGKQQDLEQKFHTLALPASVMPAPPFASGLSAHTDPYLNQTPQDPRVRPLSRVTVNDLRTFAETYDVLAACIAHLINQTVSTPIKFVPVDDKDNSDATKARIKKAQRWFDSPNGIGGPQTDRATFEGRLLNDLLVVGAAAAAYHYDTVGAEFDGNPDSVVAIDAVTIRPLVTLAGFAPSCDEDAYEQWVQGIAWRRASCKEVFYKGLPIFAGTQTPYYKSAVEKLVMVVYAALKSDEWNRAFFTSGNTPDLWMKMPPDMTPEQAKQWEVLFDAYLAGNTAGRRKIKLSPGDVTGQQSRREMDFQAFDEWLMTRTCAVMGVNPASIGFNGGQYEANQEAAMGATDDRISTLRGWRISTYNEWLQMKGWGDTVKVVDDLPDGESQKERTDRHIAEISGGFRTINEVRQEQGLDPVPEGNVLLIASSLVPVTRLIAPPELSVTGAPDAPNAPGGAPTDETQPNDDSGGGDDSATADDDGGRERLAGMLNGGDAERLARVFNPNQPRNEDGEWSSGGGGSTATGARKGTMRVGSPDEGRALGIPAVYKNLMVTDDPNAELRATAVSGKGKTQYYYTPEYSRSQAGAKFERVQQVHRALPAMREKWNSEIQSGGPNAHEAMALRLISQTGFRNGGTDGGGKVPAYGASSLRTQDVTVHPGGRIEFDFAGKGGHRQHHFLVDPVLAAHIQARQASGKATVFDTDDAKVRDYLKKTGGEFKVHDLRTRTASAMAAHYVGTLGKAGKLPRTEKEFKAAQNAIADKVARKLGDTRSVVMSSYVHPAAWDDLRAKLA